MSKIIGIKELEAKLKKNITLKDVKKVVKQNGAELESEMKRAAVFRGHYEGKSFVNPTGTTKRSIASEFREGGLSVEVQPTTEYSPYLEYGTRLMEAQPFVKPSYEKQKEVFKNDMKKLVK